MKPCRIEENRYPSDLRTRKLIGHAGLILQNIDGIEEVEIGYWLIPEYWGKGLAREAATAFRDYGFFRNCICQN